MNPDEERVGWRNPIALSLLDLATTIWSLRIAIDAARWMRKTRLMHNSNRWNDQTIQPVYIGIIWSMKTRSWLLATRIVGMVVVLNRCLLNFSYTINQWSIKRLYKCNCIHNCIKCAMRAWFWGHVRLAKSRKIWLITNANMSFNLPNGVASRCTHTSADPKHCHFKLFR